MNEYKVDYAIVSQCSKGHKVEGLNTPCGFIPKGMGKNGYGSRIHTEYKVKLKGENIWRKVFAQCFTNAASFYIIKSGKKEHIKGSDMDRLRKANKLPRY